MVRPPHAETITGTILPTALRRIRQNTATFAAQFPSYGDNAFSYNLTPNQNWLASFWSGLLWLAYTQTNDPADCAAAEVLLPTFEARLDQGIRLNHDLGFIFTLSARAQYQLTGSAAARDLALRAADVLLARFRPVGQYIQAWKAVGHPVEGGRFIIDCMMNLPLLFWASRETGDDRYRDAAVAHARTTQQYLLRDDGGTYHSYFLDQTTAEPVGPKTHQGFADDSLWSRGQAWALHGFTMAAEWTGEAAFRASAEAAARRYMAEAPANAIVPYDFRLPGDVPHYPDSSADAIAASGLLRLADLTGDAAYRQQAAARLDILIEQAFDMRTEAQGLLLHGTQHAPFGYGIDTYTIFGDYFFLEAVLRLTGAAPDFWSPDSK
jgi:unsaturated chondroitin disaccharide hydrolase